jgi:hypothetical protein
MIPLWLRSLQQGMQLSHLNVKMQLRSLRGGGGGGGMDLCSQLCSLGNCSFVHLFLARKDFTMHVHLFPMFLQLTITTKYKLGIPTEFVKFVNTYMHGY